MTSLLSNSQHRALSRSTDAAAAASGSVTARFHEEMLLKHYFFEIEPYFHVLSVNLDRYRQLPGSDVFLQWCELDTCPEATWAPDGMPCAVCNRRYRRNRQLLALLGLCLFPTELLFLSGSSLE